MCNTLEIACVHFRKTVHNNFSPVTRIFTNPVNYLHGLTMISQNPRNMLSSRWPGSYHWTSETPELLIINKWTIQFYIPFCNEPTTKDVTVSRCFNVISVVAKPYALFIFREAAQTGAFEVIQGHFWLKNEGEILSKPRNLEKFVFPPSGFRQKQPPASLSTR